MIIGLYKKISTQIFLLCTHLIYWESSLVTNIIWLKLISLDLFTRKKVVITTKELFAYLLHMHILLATRSLLLMQLTNRSIKRSHTDFFLSCTAITWIKRAALHHVPIENFNVLKATSHMKYEEFMDRVEEEQRRMTMPQIIYIPLVIKVWKDT